MQPTKLRAVTAVLIVVGTVALVAIFVFFRRPVAPPQVDETRGRTALAVVVRGAEAKTSVFGGSVTDAATGRPVKGLAIAVRRLVAAKPAGELKLESDVAGRFRFELPRDWTDPPDARIAVSVDAPPGYVALPYRNQYGDPTDDGVALAELWREQALGVAPYFDRMLLFPTKQLKGRILDPNGKPALGVEVLACSVHAEDKVYPRRILGRAKTDAGGRFAVDVASKGVVVLYLTPDRYAPRVIKLTDPTGDLGDNKLEAGMKVSGKLLDVKGQALPGRWIRVGEPVKPQRNSWSDLEPWNVGFGNLARWCRAGPSGMFETAPLAPGEYEVTAQDPGEDQIAGRPRVGETLDAWFPPQHVTVPAMGAPEPVVLQAVRHVNVEIKVADRSGKLRDGANCWSKFLLDGTEYEAQLIGESPVRNGRRVYCIPYGASGMQIYLYPRGMSSALCDYRPGKDAAESLDQSGMNVFLKDLKRDRTLEYVWAPGVLASLHVSTRDGPSLPKGTEVKVFHPKSRVYCIAFPVAAGVYRLGMVRPEEPFTVEVEAPGYKAVSEEVTIPAGTPQRLEVVLDIAPPREKSK